MLIGIISGQVNNNHDRLERPPRKLKMEQEDCLNHCVVIPDHPRSPVENQGLGRLAKRNMAVNLSYAQPYIAEAAECKSLAPRKIRLTPT